MIRRDPQANLGHTSWAMKCIEPNILSSEQWHCVVICVHGAMLYVDADEIVDRPAQTCNGLRLHSFDSFDSFESSQKRIQIWPENPIGW